MYEMGEELFAMFDVQRDRASFCFEAVGFVIPRSSDHPPPHPLHCSDQVTNTNSPAQKVYRHQITTIILHSGPPPSVTVVSYPPLVIDLNRFPLGSLPGGKESSPRPEETNQTKSVYVFCRATSCDDC